MTPGQQLLLALAGLGAGLINGIAGGGSLVSFPALLAVGLPPLEANVTSTVGIWPGYLGGVAGFRTEVRDQRDRIGGLLPATLLGSVAGAVLLLTTPAEAFRVVAPFLVLFACGLFAAQPLVARRMAARAALAASSEQHRPERAPVAQVATFLASAYGAYFGAGLGVVLLAVLGTLLPDRLVRTNGLRGVLALIANSVAALVFLARAPVDLRSAALLAATSLVGGYIGARISRRVPTPVLRTVVITIGVVAAVRLLLG